MTRRLSAVFAALAALVLAGCSENRPGDVRVVLPISAIAFNDSVGDADTLFLKVQYAFTTTCEKNAKFEIAPIPGTPNYQVTPVVVYKADEACTGVNGLDVATLRVTDIGDGPRQFVVTGSNQSITANVVGSNSVVFVREPGIAFRVLVQDKDSWLAIPGANVEIRRLVDNFTLSEGAAGLDGRYEYIQPCDGSDLQYVISASAGGRSTNLVVRVPPARCGIPEAVVIRV